MSRRPVRDGVAAGAVAGLVAGAPSTVHAALVTGRTLEATLAAGTVLRPDETAPAKLLAAAIPVHAALSVAWGVALAGVLPERRTAWWGAAAGLAIAALDLGLLARRRPRIRALPTWPQVADHVVYGAVAGAVLAHRGT